MWTASRAPSRPQRTGSIHSIASVHSAHSRPSSIASPHLQFSRQTSRSGYESDQSSDTLNEEDYNAMPAMWQSQKQESGSAVSRLSQRFGSGGAAIAPLKPSSPSQRFNMGRREVDDDARSRASTTSTLNDQDFEFPDKTPTMKSFSAAKDRNIPYFTGMEPVAPTRVLKIVEKSTTSSKTTSTTIRSDKSIPYFTGAEPPPFSRTDKSVPYFTGVEPAPLSPLKNVTQKATAPSRPKNAMGPLESQLAALMAKVQQIETTNPAASVSPKDYAEMKARVKTLEDEKKAWTKRHEAIWELRDQDVENNIKIRGELAKTRRELETMTKLRDEDLANVQVVRLKLAETTRQLDRLKAQGPAPSGRISPNRGGRPPSMMLERRDTTDLFAAAKAAALEQRALEMEKRNTDLRNQLETLKSGAGPEDLNRMTAHQAWKDHVASLEAKVKAKDSEIAQLRSARASSRANSVSTPSGGAMAPSGAVEWHRVEAIHEAHADYREKMGDKLRILRSEKEGLQRKLDLKEDECHALDLKIQKLERRVSVIG